MSFRCILSELDFSPEFLSLDIVTATQGEWIKFTFRLIMLQYIYCELSLNKMN